MPQANASDLAASRVMLAEWGVAGEGLGLTEVLARA